MDDDYTAEPNHVRIFIEPWSDGPSYSIDGADDEGRYTTGCWSGYQTLEDALADAPAFVEASVLDGVRWQWEPDRPKGLRRAPLWGSCPETQENPGG